MHMDYKVTMTQFVISDISINADPAQLTDIQTPINISTEFSFTCRPRLTRTMQRSWWNVSSKYTLPRIRSP